MFIVVGKPIASPQNALTDWLNGLSGSNAVILGVVLGLMMCFDMGGPLNKVAYAFAVGGLADPTPGSLKVMAAVMAAGMVPPLALALARPYAAELFTATERENGRAAWVLGASFITEGAIPFAAADPLRVIPSVMAGGAVTGALSMAFGCTLRAPHGGVFVVPLIGEPFLYLLAIAAGTAVSTALVVVLKGMRKTTPDGHEEKTREGGRSDGRAEEPVAVARPPPVRGPGARDKRAGPQWRRAAADSCTTTGTPQIIRDSCLRRAGTLLHRRPRAVLVGYTSHMCRPSGVAVCSTSQRLSSRPSASRNACS